MAMRRAALSLRLTRPEPASWKAAAHRNAGATVMADTKLKHKPDPESGYREQQDPRGQPGQHQNTDGRQLPEHADKAKPKPREP